MIVLDTLRKDKESFLFTLKNPHGVPPTRFKNTKSNTTSIEGNNFFGPLFGADRARYDINICDCCNKPNGCWIINDGEHGYECDHTKPNSESKIRNSYQYHYSSLYSPKTNLK